MLARSIFAACIVEGVVQSCTVISWPGTTCAMRLKHIFSIKSDHDTYNPWMAKEITLGKI